jgi:hypothetical protein
LGKSNNEQGKDGGKMPECQNQQSVFQRRTQRQKGCVDPATLSREQWAAMRDVDLRSVDKSELVDLQTVEIDTSLPPQQRMASFLEQIRNPYCFRVGDMVVKTKYSESGPSFEDSLVAMIQRLDR